MRPHVSRVGRSCRQRCNSVLRRPSGWCTFRPGRSHPGWTARPPPSWPSTPGRRQNHIGSRCWRCCSRGQGWEAEGLAKHCQRHCCSAPAVHSALGGTADGPPVAGGCCACASASYSLRKTTSPHLWASGRTISTRRSYCQRSMGQPSGCKVGQAAVSFRVTCCLPAVVQPHGFACVAGHGAACRVTAAHLLPEARGAGIAVRQRRAGWQAWVQAKEAAWRWPGRQGS